MISSELAIMDSSQTPTRGCVTKSTLTLYPRRQPRCAQGDFILDFSSNAPMLVLEYKLVESLVELAHSISSLRAPSPPSAYLDHLPDITGKTPHRPTLMTPAATSFWIFDRTLGFFICSCRAAGSDWACCKMDCITGSCMILMIYRCIC